MPKRLVSLVVLLAGLVGFTGSSSAASTAMAPAASENPPYGTPYQKLIWKCRVADGTATPNRAGTNYAVVFLRASSLAPRLSSRAYAYFGPQSRRVVGGEPTPRLSFIVREAAEIEQTDPDLYAELTSDGMHPNDVVVQTCARSVPRRGHSEQVILRKAGEYEYRVKRLEEGATEKQIERELAPKNRIDITPSQFIGGESELAPCSTSGPKCFRYSKGMRYMVGYTTAEEKQSFRRIKEGLIRNQNDWERRNGGGGPFDPPPVRGSGGRSNAATPGSGSLRQRAAKAAIGDPGGIDFSTVELRQLSALPDDGTGFDYGVVGQPSSAQTDPMDLQGLIDTSDSFYVWLALDRSKFWVNLNPNEPDRIMDEQFGRTRTGRILLDADFDLKKIGGHLVYGDTRFADDFWRQIWSHQGGKCISTRLWITSGVAKVYSEGDRLYILDAPLKVQAETDYIQDTGNGRYKSCPRQPERVDRHNRQVYNRLILPEISRAVNKDPDFAALRRVYYSRIAAESVRQRAKVQETGLEDVIDSGDASRWESKQRWVPNDTFKQYVSYHTKLQKCFERPPRSACTREALYGYASGGVDFGTIEQRRVSKAEFESRWPQVTASQAYVKGTTSSRPAPRSEVAPVQPKPAATKSFWATATSFVGPSQILGAGLLIVGGLAIVLAWRIPRRRRQSRDDSAR
jgi:hypothetical protein